MSKEIFIAAHEEMIEQYMADHPDVEWAEAYEITANDPTLNDRYVDKYAGMVDAARQRAKDAM
jgi:hypothetical protein